MNTLLITGLGNHRPAELKYNRPLLGTRHNAGYELIDRLRASLGLAWHFGAGSLYTDAVILAGRTVRLTAPNHTDLNGSGHDLNLDFLAPQQVLPVLDDLDLPAGTLRYRGAGSSGGHRGLQNILDVYGNVPRIRVGIGRPPEGTSVLEHVMGPLQTDDLSALTRAVPELLALLELHLPRLAR